MRREGFLGLPLPFVWTVDGGFSHLSPASTVLFLYTHHVWRIATPPLFWFTVYVKQIRVFVKDVFKEIQDFFPSPPVPKRKCENLSAPPCIRTFDLV